MSISRAWTCTLLALALSIGGPWPSLHAASSVAEAKQKLEAARSSLDQAVKRIEKDPPSPEDLSAAERAVGVLKAAIDAGAKFEPKDLEYAKAALAARKELRKSREYVEQRLSMANIFDRRRSIDRALSVLTKAAERTRAKSPAPEDFNRAASAARSLGEELDKARELEKQDASFASYVGETRKRLAATTKEIEDRQTELAVQAQRARMEQGKKQLASAITPLNGKQVTDAQFDAAEAAASGLAKLVDQGKVLESKDKDYRGYAAEVDKEIRRAKKTIEDRWSEAGLARLRAEIEPSHKDLIQLAKALRARNPSPDRLAEARTAAIVVSKLLEKSQHLADRSRAVRLYLAEVKKSLVEVQVNLQRRRVEPARADVAGALKNLWGKDVSEKTFLEADQTVRAARRVLGEGDPLEKEDREYATYAREVKRQFDDASTKIVARRAEIHIERQKAAIQKARADLARALRPLERRAPSYEQFDEANTAAIVFEKTVEGATGVKDRGFQSYLSEMRSLLVTSRRSIDRRRLEVDVERQKARVEEGRRDIAEAMKKIWGKNTPDERLAEVEQAIERVKKLLAEGNELVSKDSKYAAYDREVKKRLDETAARIITRRDELEMLAQQARVQAGLKGLEKALAAIDGFGDKVPAIKAAEDALSAAQTDLEAGAELEKKLFPYRTWARQAKKTVDISKIRLEKKKLQFAVSSAKSEIEERIAASRALLNAASQPTSSSTDLSKAGTGLAELGAKIKEAGPLEAQDKGHANFASRAQAQLAELEADLALARTALDFRKSVVGALEKGSAAAQDAQDSKNLELARDEYQKAVHQFEGCLNRGASLLESQSRLEAFVIIAEKARIQAKEVIPICKARLDSAAGALNRVQGVLAFHSGPAKSYEGGLALLASAKTADANAKKRLLEDALARFDNCISSGKILQHKNPELEKQEFVVAGKKTTLPKLVAECVQQAKTLRSK